MDKILIFTGYADLGLMDGIKVEQKQIPLLNDCDVLVFDENKDEFRIAASSKEGAIFLIKDDIKAVDFLEFIGRAQLSLIGILRHREPKHLTFDNYAGVKDGQHEHDGKYYPEILDIITDQRKDKFQRLYNCIFKIDPILKAKIKVIHAIQNGEIPDNMHRNLEGYQTAIEAFRPYIDKPWLSEDYIRAFRKLLEDFQLET